MLKDLPALLTPNKFAEVTGCDPNDVRVRCRKGKLPARKIGGKWFIHRDTAFADFIAMEQQHS